MNPELTKHQQAVLKALVDEEFARANQRAWIDNPAAWKRNSYNRKLEALQAEPRRIKDLDQHADRLGIGLSHPPAYNPALTDPHPAASPSDENRWLRIQRAMIRLPAEHPLRVAIANTCTKIETPLYDKRTNSELSAAENMALTILDFLEQVAIENGINLDTGRTESAPVVDLANILKDVP